MRLFGNSLVFLFVLVCISYTGYGQVNVPFKKSAFLDDIEGLKTAKHSIKQGNDKIKDDGDFNAAVKYYLKAQDFNPDNVELNILIGDCYLNGLDKTKSLHYFEHVLELTKSTTASFYLKLGRARHLNCYFDSAIDAYSEYKKRKTNLSDEESQKINKYITECRYGEELIMDTLDVEIVNLGNDINTEYGEYNPMILTDGSRIIYTARRKYAGNPIDPLDKQPCEDVWYSDLGKDGSWKKSKRFASPINTKGHDAISGISTDGQLMYIYKAVENEAGNIFYTKVKGERWTKPISMPKGINTKYHESKVSLSYDGKTLYLISKRPENSIGGRDIFVSNLMKNGQWTEPENIGPVINTSYDEEGVFIHPDGRTLYFCSQGHNSMGGFDIFKSVKDKDENWSTPVNLGYPINTPGDEAFWSITADGYHAYISSVRSDGFGDYDLYEVIYPKREGIEKVGKLESRLTLITGYVKDFNTLKPLEADVEIVDNEKNESIAVVKSNELTGKFIVSLPSGKNYGLSVNKVGYMFHSENFNIKDSSKFNNIVKEILLQPMEVGTKVVLQNIFFDYDKATLRKESFLELDKIQKIMESNPNMIIEISGHTDNKGSFDYNEKLSRERAKSVVDYLIEHGVQKSRLSYKGYAFSQPISENDTEKGRQLNRRVEFKVLEND